MKKLLSMLLVLAMVSAVLVGCSQPESGDSGNEDTSEDSSTDAGDNEGEASGDINGMTVGYCMPDTSESFLAGLSNGVKELFADDNVTVEIADAAGDASTQLSQIENFAASGTDLIIVMAVDPTSVTDAIKRAQDSGSMVMVAGSDTGAYDAIMYTDQYEDGKLIAEMGAEWIEENFPDAEAGSIEIALLEDRSTPEANQRCDGINTITELTDKINIVQTVGSIKNNDEAQAATENILQTNPDIKMILSYNSSAAIGVNEAIMRDSSIDKGAFAVFCSDEDEAALELIKLSGDDEAVLRGLVRFGSDDLIGDTYRLAKEMLSGADYTVDNPDPLTIIRQDNVGDFM